MINNLKKNFIVPIWGFATLGAWILTFVMGSAGFYTNEILAMWTVLMSIPVGYTAILYRQSRSNKLLNFWAATVSFFLVLNFVTPSSLALYSYFHLWIVVGFIGIYYTAKKVPSPYNKIYKYSIYASVAMVPVLMYRPYLTPIPAAVVQGLPMLYDYYRN